MHKISIIFGSRRIELGYMEEMYFHHAQELGIRALTKEQKAQALMNAILDRGRVLLEMDELCFCACHMYPGTYPTSRERPCSHCGHVHEDGEMPGSIREGWIPRVD
jgi:hypothetical protein